MAEIDDAIRNLIKTNGNMLTALLNLGKRVGLLETYLFNRKRCKDCFGRGVRRANDGCGRIDEWDCDTCDGEGYLINGMTRREWLEEHPELSKEK